MTLNSGIKYGCSPKPPSSLSSAPRRCLTCASRKAAANEEEQGHRKGDGGCRTPSGAQSPAPRGPPWGQLETRCTYGVSDPNPYPSSVPVSCVTLDQVPSLSDGQYPLRANRVNNHIRHSLGD